MDFASSYIYSYDNSDEECVSDEELEHQQKQGAFGGIQSRHARPNDVTGISWNKQCASGGYVEISEWCI